MTWTACQGKLQSSQMLLMHASCGQPIAHMCAEEDEDEEVNEAIEKLHLIKAMLYEAELGLKIVAHLVSGVTPCKMVFGEYDRRAFNTIIEPLPLFKELCDYAMPIKYPRSIRQGTVRLFMTLCCYCCRSPGTAC